MSNCHHLQCGPSTADRLGEVGEGSDEEALLVLAVALNSNTASSGATCVKSRCGVDTEVEVAVDGLQETHVLGLLCGLVADITTRGVDIVVVPGGVVALEKGSSVPIDCLTHKPVRTYHKEAKLLEEVGGVIAVHLLVGLLGGNGRGKKEGGRERGEKRRRHFGPV